MRRKIYLLFPQERKMEGRRDESAKGKRGVRKGVCVCVCGRSWGAGDQPLAGWRRWEAHYCQANLKIINCEVNAF